MTDDADVVAVPQSAPPDPGGVQTVAVEAVPQGASPDPAAEQAVEATPARQTVAIERVQQPIPDTELTTFDITLDSGFT